jgi:replicative DNA helicase
VVEQIKNVPAEPLTVDEQIEQIQALALGLEDGKPATEYCTFAEAEKVAAEIGDEGTLVKTGLKNIDNIISGVAPGELIIIAGRPSMGKSALALQLAVNMAKSGLSVLFFSLEMTHRALIQRALKNGDVQELANLDIVLHERGDTPEKQIAFIKSRRQLSKVDVVFIDYLQLMNCGRKNDNRVSEISEISRKLKLAAVSESVPIIALSQLNRQVEQRDKHRPRLSDLRESGAIEQDADLVMLLHREDVYRRQDDPKSPQDGSAELILAKNRRGKTGIANLVFLDERVCFGDKTNFSEGLNL